MKPSSLLLALVAGGNAHTLMSKFYIDGQAQDDGTCIRMPSDPNTATDPIASLASTDMACGVNGTTGVPRVCSVNGGSTLTFEYREWPDDASKGSIDTSHKGPCAVYLKKVQSAITDTAAGDGWFKIWDEGYDESTSQWCTEKLINNDGHLSVDIPSSLQSGYYLVRPELLALHQADKTPSDPQFYVGCVQIFLQSSGSSLPDSSDTVSIPGYVEAGQASVTFDIWSEPMALPYPIPGPVVYNASTNGVSRIAKASLKQTEGLESADCVLTNANWCGIELDQYTTSDGCWNASSVCWDECTDCYNTAPPTGSSNCKIWEAKCQNIDDTCNAGNYNGPPNYMKVLTPTLSTISVPAADGSQDGDGSYLPATLSSAEEVVSLTSVAFSTYMASSAYSSSGFATSIQTSATALASFVKSSATTSISSTEASIIALTSSSEASASAAVVYVETAVVTDYVVVTVGSTVYATPTALSKREEAEDTTSSAGASESASNTVSTDGTCGNGVTCLGSTFGDCCGGMDYTCGSDIGTCGYNCQGDYGMCEYGINKRTDEHLHQEVRRTPNDISIDQRLARILAYREKRTGHRTIRKTISQRMREVGMME